MTTNIEEALPRMAQAERPYPPSWPNRLFKWIDRRPGPAWPYYIGGLLLSAALLTLAVSMLDDVPLGTIDIQTLLFCIYPIYFIALMHYLDGEARAALAKFRPVLQVSDAEYARIEYELTTVPAKGAWFVTAVALFPTSFWLLEDVMLILSQPAPLIGLALLAVINICGVASFFILVYHTIRQLRMVNRIHATAPVINLFQATPAYAFSQLTARTGIGLILFAYFSLLQNPPDPCDPFTYVLLSMLLVVAAAAFVLPLVGMHQRLLQEKRRLESEINRGVESIHRAILQSVETQNFAGVEDLDKVLSSLLSLREVVGKLSTWPWQAETLRGFVSALLVPILLWAVTQLLERYLVF